MDRVKNINRLAYWTAMAALPQWQGYACIWRPNAETYYVALGVEEVKSGDDLSTLDRIQRAGRYWFGFLSYDLKNNIEKLTTTRPHPMSFPGLLFFSPKVLIRVAHEKEEVLVELTDGAWKNAMNSSEGIELREAFDWKPMQSRESYIDAVRQLKRHIQQGDIYEVNYCTAFETDAKIDQPLALFQVLNERTEAPYATFFSWPGRSVLCGSPELYLEKQDRRVKSSPIKGTVKRGQTPQEDAALSRQLREDKKEQGENVMIVDLVRNDLSRIAAPNTVVVDELFGIYTFKTVHHMISTVSCTLRDGVKLSEIVKATFPMGSMTGAPKISAMQLADQYEIVGRGLYSGSIGMITPNGDFEWNVVIRSMLIDHEQQKAYCHVGGAITALCDEEKEYAECQLKAKAVLSIENLKYI